MSATTQIWRPSSARRVALDGFAPVPRGASQAVPPAPAWPAKDPADVLDYEVDILAAIAGHPHDAITGVSVVPSPTGPGHLGVGAIATDGPVAAMWLSGGQAGTTYKVQVTITTASGRVLGRAIALPVLALAQAAPAAGTLVTGGGATVTDQNGNPILLGG